MNVLKGIALGMAGFFLFIILPLLASAFAINNTVLNPNFAADEIKKLDIGSMSQDLIVEQLPAQYQSYTPAINASINDLKPWLDNQINTVVFGTYEYLLGNRSDINFSIQLDPVRQVLVNRLSAAYMQSPPAGSPALSQAQVRQQIESAFPSDSTAQINSEVLGPDVMNSLDTARQITGYVHTTYIILIVLAIVLVLLIILILREIKGVSLTLGIIFLVSGILGLVSALISKHFIMAAIDLNDVPVQVQNWVPGLIKDLFSPLNWFCMGILIGGVVLLMVYFVYRQKLPGRFEFDR